MKSIFYIDKLFIKTCYYHGLYDYISTWSQAPSDGNLNAPYWQLQKSLAKDKGQIELLIKCSVITKPAVCTSICKLSYSYLWTATGTCSLILTSNLWLVLRLYSALHWHLKLYVTELTWWWERISLWMDFSIGGEVKLSCELAEKQQGITKICLANLVQTSSIQGNCKKMGHFSKLCN